MPDPHERRASFVTVEVRHQADADTWRAEATERDLDTADPIGDPIVAYGATPSAAALEARRLILARNGR